MLANAAKVGFVAKCEYLIFWYSPNTTQWWASTGHAARQWYTLWSWSVCMYGTVQA